MLRRQDGVATWQGVLPYTLTYGHIVRGVTLLSTCLQWCGAQTMGSACSALVPKISAITFNLVLECQNKNKNKETTKKPWGKNQNLSFLLLLKEPETARRDAWAQELEAVVCYDSICE